MEYRKLGNSDINVSVMCLGTMTYGEQNTEQEAHQQLDFALAEAHGLTPTQLALAFVNSRPFLTSNIIGATTITQLEENIASWDVVLSDEVLTGIQEIHQQISNPCP